MKRPRIRIHIFVILLLVSSVISAQSGGEVQIGTVSFVTSSRVYVKFDDTSTILKGDTLFTVLDERLVPALVVDQKSSLSCVGTVIGVNKLQKGDLLQFNGRVSQVDETTKQNRKPLEKKEDKVKGSVSLASYVNASSATDFDARNVARVRFSFSKIANSRFSLDSYLIYRQNLESTETGIHQNAGLFNVYGLSLTYAKENSYSFSIGRKVNRRVASLGLIDGLHLEKQLGLVHLGGIAGFRPDSRNNAFNSSQMQYGAYAGISGSAGQKSFGGTVGVLEQKSRNAIDRRYLYLQNSINMGAGFSIFSSAELDLYSLDTLMREAGIRLTNLHISTHYRLGKKVRLSMSYDTRRNIIFYETFRTQLERLIADDEARQGIRGRVNVKLTKQLSGGFAYGKRYQNSGENTSSNYNAFATLRKAPLIGGVLSGNINVNQSSYLNSISTTFRHNRYYFKNKINASTYLRTVAYSYNPERDVTIVQQFVGSSINYRFGNKMALRGLVEFSLRKAEYKSRVNLQLTKRF